MMQSVKAFFQVGFIAGLLGIGSAVAADTPATTNGKPAPTAVDTSGPSQLIESSANVILGGIDARRRRGTIFDNEQAGFARSALGRDYGQAGGCDGGCENF